MTNEQIQEKTFYTRIATIQCAYSVIFMNKELNIDILNYFKNQSFLNDDEIGEKQEINDKLFTYLVNGVVKNKEKLDSIILQFLKLPIEKNDPLLITIIRTGTFELLNRDKTPWTIIVSEYTKIAKSFFTENKTAFVNAILDKIAKSNFDKINK